MDPIKEAFEKIKQDISFLKTELVVLRQAISELKLQNQTNPAYNPTQLHPPISTPAHTPTDPLILEALKYKKTILSTGNEGVPTDNSTDRQTHPQTDSYSAIEGNYSVYAPKKLETSELIRFMPSVNSPQNDFEKAKDILDSLDSIKKEIRLRFKRLTPQEMQVFSTLYALEEQNYEEISYKILAQRLNLTESSIRDYVTKLIFKGIPVLKVRQNNKKISLSISSDLKKIASLSTITKLREL